jgi:hypothetical protein
VKRIIRAIIAGLGVAALSLFTPAPPASAGFIPDSIYFSFYDGAWSPWVTFFDFPGLDLEGVTAVIIALPTSVGSSSNCFYFTQPNGTQQQFTYSVDANRCIEVEGVSSAGTLPLAWFVWIPISDGVPGSFNPCWNVSGSTSTDGDFNTRIRFTETLFSGSLATESARSLVESIVAQMSATGVQADSFETRERLYGIPYVPFVLGIDPEEQPTGAPSGPEDLIWTIGVSIRSCRGDVDDDLFEHYLRQAEQVTALPDTR